MKVSVLFVCLGNICRSPLAEAIFKHKVKQKGLKDSFEADSCGTADYHIGDAPDPRTLANAKKNGITIQHFCRQLQADDLKEFDFILAMDEGNYQNILRLKNAGQYRHKISLLREFDPVGKGDVPDPYYGNEQKFQEVFEILNRTLDHFIQYLEESQFSKSGSVNG